MLITAWFKQAYDTFSTPVGRQLSTFILTSQKLDAIAAYKACWMISLMHFVVFQTKSCFVSVFFVLQTNFSLWLYLSTKHWIHDSNVPFYWNVTLNVCMWGLVFFIIDKYKTTVRNSCLANWENESTRKCISE